MELSEKKAINAKQVKVTFNKSVDKDTAQNKLNYAITKANSAAATTVNVDTAKLQDDKKTVILNLDTALNNDTKAEYTVNVKDVKTAVTGDKIAEFSKVVSLFDNTALAVEGITLADANTIHVEFTEPVNATTSNAVAGAIQFKLSGVSVSVPSSAYTLSDDKKSVKIDIAAAGLEAGKSYTVVVDGLTDFAYNALPRYETAFTVSKDEVKPELQSITSLSLAAFKVVFSEPVKNSQFSVNIGGQPVNPSSIVKDTNDETGKTYIVTLSSNQTAGNHLVTVYNYTDIAGNTGVSTVKEVNFAAAKPTLTATTGEVKTIAGVKYQVYTYDRSVKLNSGVTTFAASYVDLNNVTHSNETVSVKDSSTLTALANNQIAIPLTSLSGKYTVNVAAGNVKDLFGQSADAITLKFDTTSEVSQTTVASVLPNGTVGGTTDTDSLNKVTVKFADFVGDDALEVAHYTVDGVQVFESAIFDGNKKTVTLTVKPGAITSSNPKTVKITGIKNVEDKTFTGVNFVENVKPTVVKNELLAYNKVQLTFSEALVGTPAASDFKVTVDGKETTAFAVSNVNDKVIITLNTPVSSSSVPVTVAVVTDNLKDVAGNTVEQKDLGTATVNLSDTTLAYTNSLAKLVEATTALTADNTNSTKLVTLKNALAAAKDAKVAAGVTAAEQKITDAETAITNAETAIANKNAVADAKAALATPTIATNGADLGTLPTNVGTTGVTVAWTSSDTSKLTDAGAWVSGASAGDVTLTATITKGASTTTVTYKVTVNDTKITAIAKN